MDNEQLEYPCGMCLYTSRSRLSVVQHMVRHHRYDPNFVATCNYQGCGASYRVWASFKSHVSRKHPTVILVEDPHVQEPQQEPGLDDEENVDANEDFDMEFEVNEPNVAENLPDIEGQYVKFIQDLREGCNVSQTATDIVAKGLMGFSIEYSSALKNQLLRSANEDGNISSHNVEKVFGDLDVLQSISGVKTKFLLDKYLIKSGFLILPEKVLLAEKWGWIRKPELRMALKPVYFQEIPFLPQLKQILNQQDVLYCIDHPRPSLTNGLLRDYLDGEYVKNHPIFSNDPHALQIILYYDDVEIVNPLGSKTKTHKLAMFYWTLGNIYPKYRSTLKVINLLCIVKTIHLRSYGVDKILEHFVRDLKQLESPEGITFDIRGVDRNFRGSLLMFTGDTLAANYLGGFKEGVAFAKKPCRSCLASHDSIQESFKESDFLLRDKVSHADHCNDINNPELSPEAKKYWSKEYGITAESILCQLETFDVTKCLVQDLMHTGIEGCLELELRHFLVYCTQTNHFIRLSKLNENIDNFDYGHLSKDKPSPIDRRHLDNKLRQNCAQLLTLGNCMPFLLDDCLDDDDEYLLNLVLLLQILNMMLAFSISVDEVFVMKQMIEQHNLKFIELYRSATPKLHFMIHIPSQILRFGPCRHQWCMRFEAAHCRFKHLATVVKNFKNISYTLAYRHQSLRCSEIFSLPNEPDKNILVKADVVGKGIPLKLVNYEFSILVANCLEPCDLQQPVLKTRKVVVRGISYEVNGIILLLDEDDNLPQFGIISEIIIYETKKVLVYKKMRTLQFFESRNSYEVQVVYPPIIDAMQLKNLIHPHALSLFKDRGSSFVVLLNHQRNEFF